MTVTDTTCDGARDWLAGTPSDGIAPTRDRATPAGIDSLRVRDGRIVAGAA